VEPFAPVPPIVDSPRIAGGPRRRYATSACRAFAGSWSNSAPPFMLLRHQRQEPFRNPVGFRLVAITPERLDRYPFPACEGHLGPVIGIPSRFAWERRENPVTAKSTFFFALDSIRYGTFAPETP
jgi:hypothetical protein